MSVVFQGPDAALDFEEDLLEDVLGVVWGTGAGPNVVV
jgi:hypothetical protein